MQQFCCRETTDTTKLNKNGKEKKILILYIRNNLHKCIYPLKLENRSFTNYLVKVRGKKGRKNQCVEVRN